MVVLPIVANTMVPPGGNVFEIWVFACSIEFNVRSNVALERLEVAVLKVEFEGTNASPEGPTVSVSA